MMLKLPVEETKIDVRAMTVSMATIWTPSMHACRAQKESPSTTNTRAPEPTESERTFQHTTQDEGMKFDLWRIRHHLEFPR